MDIKVSVVCPAYNCKDYIKETIQHILAQKTTFPFELILHDDCSSDGTADICRQYSMFFPDKVIFIPETENQFSKERLGKKILPFINGEYTAFCEDDDIWTDEYKLEKQVKALEEHKELDICAHAADVWWYPANGLTGQKIQVSEIDGIIKTSDVIEAADRVLPLSTVMIRSDILKDSDSLCGSFFHEREILISGAMRGGLFYLAESMASVRIDVPGSLSEKLKTDIYTGIQFNEKRAGNFLSYAMRNESEYTALFEKAAKELSDLNIKSVMDVLDAEHEIKERKYKSRIKELEREHAASENAGVKRAEHKNIPDPEPGLMLTVMCLTFNHAEYIRDALEGFVKQQTEYRFEVVVHDDCSTDGTDKICREYADKYPDIIKFYPEEENRYSKGTLGQIVRSLAHGKYIALCEGDDYWTDPQKIQKQLSALEARPDVDICAHSVRQYDVAAGTFRPALFGPSYEDETISPERVIEGDGQFVATCSLMMRREIYIADNFFPGMRTYDHDLQMRGAMRGGMLYLKDPMAVYRVNAAGSWTMNMAADRMKFVKYNEERIAIFMLYMGSEGAEYADSFKKLIDMYTEKNITIIREMIEDSSFTDF